jgi:hypothetical protein
VPIIPLPGFTLSGFVSRHAAAWCHLRTEKLGYQSQLFALQWVSSVVYVKRPDTVGQPQSVGNCASHMPSWKAQEHRVFEAESATVSRGKRLTNSIRRVCETHHGLNLAQ